MTRNNNRWEIKEFNRSSEELSQIFEFLENLLDEAKLDDRTRYAINLSVEELFTNMVRHNRKGEVPIEIGYKIEDGNAMIRLSDREEEPFDITKTERVNFDQYIEERRVGGLGIELVKEMMDDIDFHHEQGISTITLTKMISGEENA